MKTIIYISRHSEPLWDLVEEYKSDETEQIRNEKLPLSVEGEKKAKVLSSLAILKNIDIVYSSHYVRAVSTAKYIAQVNNIKINIDSRLGERRFGVEKHSDIPEDFYMKQYEDFNYKIGTGESLNEVHKRMVNCIYEILDKNKGKTIMIVSHGTALSTLFSTWCDLRINKETKWNQIYFKDKCILEGKWNTPELFKLTFNDEDLIDINNIKIDYSGVI